MKALDIKTHKTNLTNILIDIFKNNSLAPFLGFKGGTAAMLFYNLPRFSLDLDLDLVGGTIDTDKITNLLSAKYEIKDQSTKYNTLFWLLSYGTGKTKIKVEISTRDNSYNHYHLLPFYGVTIPVLEISDMIAHKMVALTERKTTANRDLFDVHFFLSGEYASQINFDVIKKRTKRNPKEFYKFLLKTIDKVDNKNILSGLGEVLTEPQKDWAKAKLLIELKGLIQRQIDFI